MPIDLQNVVVRYCAEGIELEQTGQRDEALRLFALAWEESRNAFERTIADTILRGVKKHPKKLFTEIKKG